MQCPSCDRSLKPNAKSCGCGWEAPDKPRRVEPALDLDRWRCAWMAGPERCWSPGAVSHGTLGMSAWYCAAHLRCDDPSLGAKIVAESRNPKPRITNGYASPAVVNTAWDIAKRHGNKPWQTEHKFGLPEGQ